MSAAAHLTTSTTTASRGTAVVLVHRDEASGTLHGLMRLRQFTQDDGHIFCRDDQVAGEVEAFCRELPAFYRRFGFDDVAVALSLRPENRLGDDAWWDRAEAELAEIVARLGLPCEVQPDAGAIYGPKLEFILRDLGPEHVLVAPDGELAAVIDWEEVGLGDPVWDLAWWLEAAPAWGEQMHAAYGAVDRDRMALAFAVMPSI